MQPKVFTQVVCAAPDAVWWFLSDLRNDTAWRHEIKLVELVSGEPHEPGSRYRETVVWNDIDAEVELTVAESVPASRLVIVSDSAGYRSRSAWSFDPRSGKGSLVTLVFAIEASGALRLVEPAMAALVTGWLERDLRLLEGHLSCQ